MSKQLWYQPLDWVLFLEFVSQRIRVGHETRIEIRDSERGLRPRVRPEAHVGSEAQGEVRDPE